MDKPLKIALPVPLDGAEGNYPNYFNALKGLGTQPVAVAPDCDPADYDGLLLPGGADVSPCYYHEENVACEELEPELDELQWAVLEKFATAKKPIFGICRGHQLMNAFFGGTLIQNLDSRARHARDKGSSADKVHASTAVAGGFIAKLYGENLFTNRSHHQAVDRVAEGFRVAQMSDDGVVEALEHVSLPFASVQWHPERMCFAYKRADTVDGSVVIGHFLRVCEEARNK